MLTVIRKSAVILLTAALLLGVVLADAIASPQASRAGAESPISSARSLTAVAGGPGFIMVNPMQLQPRESGTAWAYFGQNLYNPSMSWAEYGTGLTLPHGVTLNKVVLYFLDNSLSNDIEVYLYRCDVSNGICYEMSALYSYGFDAGYRSVETTALSNAVVDNQSYSYSLRVHIPGSNGTNLQLVGVRLDYALPSTTYFPMITN